MGNQMTASSKKSETIVRHIDSMSKDSEIQGLSDKVLWSRFKEGNEEAFIRIYSNNFQILIDYGYQLTHHIQQTEDLVHDLFMNLRKSRNKLPVIKSSIKVYLMVSLKNRFLNSLRKIDSKFSRLDDYHTNSFKVIHSPEQELIDQQTNEITLQKLRKRINGLPLKQREVVFYHFYEGLSYEEIKNLLDLQNIKSARNLIYKAIKSLRSHMLTLLLFLPSLF